MPPKPLSTARRSNQQAFTIGDLRKPTQPDATEVTCFALLFSSSYSQSNSLCDLISLGQPYDRDCHIVQPLRTNNASVTFQKRQIISIERIKSGPHPCRERVQASVKSGRVRPDQYDRPAGTRDLL